MMIDVMSAVLSLYLGMMCLNLAMDKPFKAQFRREIRRKDGYLLRIVGSLALCLALYFCGLLWSIGIAITAWFGIASLVLALLVFIQAYPRKYSQRIFSVCIFIFITIQLLRFFGRSGMV